MYDLLIGLEVEAIYNNYLLNLNHGSYHRAGWESKHKFGDYFVVETDSSIRTEGDYEGSAELVSCPFPSKEIQEVSRNFERETLKRTKKEDLKDVFKFNSSCGCHVNVSLTKDSAGSNILIRSERGEILFKNKSLVPLAGWINHKMLLNIRESFEQKIFNAWGGKELENFKKQYNRSYAQLCEKKLMYKQKYSELHIREFMGRLEFRGFHLLNATTWEKFHWYLKEYINTLRECILNEVVKTDKNFVEAENMNLNFVVKYKKINKIMKELI